MPSSHTKFPARLHAIIARDAAVGVIFRKGPAKSVGVFHWDYSKDKFSVGQWLFGRIYERRCDLSPDGKHLIYFAFRENKRNQKSFNSWTAISKAPYLTAIDFFPKGDTWGGGGLFLSNDTYWTNHHQWDDGGHSKGIPESSGLMRQEQAPALTSRKFGNECLGVYYPRLIRDGWELIDLSVEAEVGRQTIFEKPLRTGWKLRKIAHETMYLSEGKGVYWDEHELVNYVTGHSIKCPDWEWAEVNLGSIVWAEKGSIFRAKTSENHGHETPILLHDFNPEKFQSIEAPY